ncbi:MAG TPA: transposase, partial [Verrucomicrobiae bacterium]|nr:transposase [Verrucomicrobiae bacterium]
MARQRCWFRKLRILEGRLKVSQQKCLEETKLIYQAALQAFRTRKKRCQKVTPSAVRCVNENSRKRACPYSPPTFVSVLMVMVLPANIQDRDGARLLLKKALALYGRIQRIWADGGYAGALVVWTQRALGCVLEIVKRSDTAAKFIVLPR